MSDWPSQRGRAIGHRDAQPTTSGLRLRAPTVVLFVGATLLVRVLTDDQSALNSRHSGSVNLSGAIAGLFIVVAGCLLAGRRRGAPFVLIAVVWLGVWTAIAVATTGASTETVREGVREASVVALGVIVYNTRSVTVSVAVRLTQLIGVIPAVLAPIQLVTHSGMDVAGNLRAHGTFAHPNSAAMFFAIAAVASLWRYLDYHRSRIDAIFTALFVTALITTFSIDGLITLVAMMVALGLLRPGSLLIKLIPSALAALATLVFFATPLGAQRITSESVTNLSTVAHERPDSSLAWRLHKWKTLLGEWEHSPIYGKGLGTTVTEESATPNEFIGDLPHNEYLRYLVETGVVGLLTLLMALVLLVRRLLRDRKLVTGAVNPPSLAIVIVLGSTINALADNTLLYSTAGYVTALIVVAALHSSEGPLPQHERPGSGAATSPPCNVA